MDLLKQTASKKLEKQAVEQVKETTGLNKFMEDKPIVQKGVEKVEELIVEPEPEPTLKEKGAEKAVEAGASLVKGFMSK